MIVAIAKTMDYAGYERRACVLKQISMLKPRSARHVLTHARGLFRQP